MFQRTVTGLDNCPKDAPDHRILLEYYQLTNNDTGLEKRYPINDPKTSNIQKDGQQLPELCVCIIQCNSIKANIVASKSINLESTNAIFLEYQPMFIQLQVKSHSPVRACLFTKKRWFSFFQSNLFTPVYQHPRKSVYFSYLQYVKPALLPVKVCACMWHDIAHREKECKTER